MEADSERYLTVAQVASMLQIDEHTVRQKLRRGELRGVRLGSGWRVRARDLDRWLASMENTPAPTDEEGKP